MKLNNKLVIFVGFAFFLICAFWQAYDNIVPLILTNKFGMNQAWSGVIMALDNVLALFMLPLFGALSDKTHTRLGRRTPYIIGGAAAAIIGLQVLAVADKLQVENLTKYGSAAAATAADKGPLLFFIAVLLFVLIAMSVFRSPAVALMPDVTIKPLRSKANAIINLMGTAGGLCVLVLGILFGTGKSENASMSYMIYFGCIGGLMLLALAIFLWKVREPRFAKEMEAESARWGIDDGTAHENGSGSRKLSPEERKSLLLILASVVLWFFGYNAVTSKFSVYSTNVLGLDFNANLTIATVAAVIAYLPVGLIASRIGRKKTILAGIVILGVSFGVASFIRSGSSPIIMDVLFALAGIGWATINVNSYPMVVELARGGDVGKYTGYYYTASMAAQMVTPILSGLLLDVNMLTLFPYGCIFVLLAFVTMSFVKHGDSKPVAAKGVEALDVDVD
jgi:Na+/melibiose symporter and related transporters